VSGSKAPIHHGLGDSGWATSGHDVQSANAQAQALSRENAPRCTIGAGHNGVGSNDNDGCPSSASHHQTEHTQLPVGRRRALPFERSWLRATPLYATSERGRSFAFTSHRRYKRRSKLQGAARVKGLPSAEAMRMRPSSSTSANDSSPYGRWQALTRAKAGVSSATLAEQSDTQPTCKRLHGAVVRGERRVKVAKGRGEVGGRREESSL